MASRRPHLSASARRRNCSFVDAATEIDAVQGRPRPVRQRGRCRIRWLVSVPDDRHGRLHSSAALDARQGVARTATLSVASRCGSATRIRSRGASQYSVSFGYQMLPFTEPPSQIRFASGRPVCVPRAAFIDMHIDRGTLRGEQRCCARSSRWHSAILFTKSVELTYLWHDIPSSVHDMRNHASAQHHRLRAI